MVLDCHWPGREAKERAIRTRFSQRYEQALTPLAAGLAKKTGPRKTAKVLERLGRLQERYCRVARFYEVRLERDEATDTVTRLHGQPKARIEDTPLGVSCLRTTLTAWDTPRLWQT